jgi:stage II sporulation protein AB (anti-sigma F factor)
MAPTHSTDTLGAAGVPIPPPSGLPLDESRLRAEARTRARDMALTSRLRLQLPASAEEVPLARAAITRLCEHLEIADRPTEDIRLAVTEACSNCALHAYDDRVESPTYTLDARIDRRDLRIVVSDCGMGLDRSRANRSRSLGYGLGMIRQLADSSHVSARPGGGTRVVMRFRLAA